jgi:type II secretory pathway component PulC
MEDTACPSGTNDVVNRYQQEVAEMDRRRAITVRVLSFVSAAVLVAAALWSARVPLSRWWSDDPPAAQTLETAGTTRAPDVTPAVAREVDATVSDVPETQQQLVLVSTAPGRTNIEGTARLGTSVRHPQTYAAGAILANGSTLTHIYTDRVVLEREGSKLTLYVADGNASRARGSADLALVGGPPRPAPDMPTLAADPLTDIIRSMPFYEHEAIAGVQVFPGQKSGVFAQLGLKSGDVITSLDAVPVADSQVAFEQLRMLTDGAALTATIRRGGKTQTIALDGRIVMAAAAPKASLLPDVPTHVAR